MTSQDSLADRYGSTTPGRRRAVVAVSAAVALVFLGWLGWVVWDQLYPRVESAMVGYHVVDEHTVTARVSVRLADDTVRASCVVRAYAEDHTVVGERAFTPSYDAEQPVSVDVRTERQATSVQLVGCTAPGEPRPR